ncbi:hypothetical protein G8S55_11260 [Clostridium botulinum C]|uniref:hypothetical protein n=1 Tax=Clostridium botulinum TaxID=1491 RepID=UPI001E537CEB|nr:hypothetical protein [Clostridium botulinum]MCD3217796.1 hypothetical protein [Clostridium botulinum C]
MKIFYSDYASRWCLGINIPTKLALKLQAMLNICYGMGQSTFQVLANQETIKFENNFNFIVSNYEKNKIEEFKPTLKKILVDYENNQKKL